MALTTTTAYKTHAGISGSGLDSVLAQVLSMAEATIRRACGRDLSNGFESTSRTEYIDGTDAETVQLSEWPVTTMTSVHIVDDAGELDEVTDYRVNTKTGVLRYIGAAPSRVVAMVPGYMDSMRFGVVPCWPSGHQNIKVVYTGGYATIPGDIVFAVHRLMDFGMAARGKGAGFQSESLGGYSYSMQAAGESDAAVAAVFAAFRTGQL
jgi:hypothetical protein